MVSFVGLPSSSKASRFTGSNGLRFGGAASVVRNGVYLQTAIVAFSDMKNDTDATSVVLYSSDDSAPSDPSGLTIVNLTLSGLPAGANERKRLILNQCHHVSLPFPDDHFVCQDRLISSTS